MIDALKKLDFNQLTVAERFDLIGCLWDSIEDESKPFDLANAQQEELRRRTKHHDEHPDDFLSWDEVKSQILSRRSE